MRYLFFLIILTAALPALAMKEIASSIYAIEYGQKQEEHLLFLNSGQVIRIPNSLTNTKMMKQLEDLKLDQLIVSFIVNDKGELKSFQKTQEKSARLQLPVISTEEEHFQPTVLESLTEAKKLFTSARYVSKESQCYNRAHIWVFEWFLNNRVNSNKTWLFFTRKYIRKYKFEWWFHVSPSVRIKDQDLIREKIMDVKYGRGPLDPKRWTDIFMRNKADCKLVKTYSDYANYPESTWCFTMRTSMYYYQPYDIEYKEIWGSIRSNWFEPELKQAYKEAFDEDYE